MSINKFRSSLYKLARFLGDVNAWSKGRFFRRAVRKTMNRKSGGGIDKLFR